MPHSFIQQHALACTALKPSFSTGRTRTAPDEGPWVARGAGAHGDGGARRGTRGLRSMAPGLSLRGVPSATWVAGRMLKEARDALLGGWVAQSLGAEGA